MALIPGFTAGEKHRQNINNFEVEGLRSVLLYKIGTDHYIELTSFCGPSTQAIFVSQLNAFFCLAEVVTSCDFLAIL